MPTIICSYCNYVGQDRTGKDTLDFDAMLQDVIEHEKTCEFNTDKEDE